jgi:hypothetical protein
MLKRMLNLIPVSLQQRGTDRDQETECIDRPCAPCADDRRSFAFGNTKIENDLITREMVDKQAEAHKKRKNG